MYPNIMKKYHIEYQMIKKILIYSIDLQYFNDTFFITDMFKLIHVFKK